MVDRDSRKERVPSRSTVMDSSTNLAVAAYHSKPSPVLSPGSSPRQRRSIVYNLNNIRNSQMYLFSPPPGHCSDCAVDPSPCASLPLSSECTDQCVVITCTDPEHELLSPASNHRQVRRSNLSCESTQCTKSDCSSFDELLRCCYLPQGSFPTNGMDFQGLNFATMPPCDCENSPLPTLSSPSSDSPSTISSSYPRTPSDFTREDLSLSSHSLPQDYHTATQPYFDPDHPAVFNTPPFTPFQSPSVQVPSGLRSTFQSPQTLQCMWANCGASFTSLSELVGHVNVQHLRLSADAPPQVAPSVTACRWDNCTLYPTPELIPGPSNPSAHYGPSVLASHLLHDHLGLSLESPASYTSFWPLGESHQDSVPPLSPQSVTESATNSPKEPTTAGGGDMNGGDATMTTMAPHPCRWKGCARMFSTDAELTDHLNVAHIGAGKAQYECHWEGCQRNGERSFTSKQKICRHLQSHTGHRPFQCRICNQNFSEAATLQQHMRRHTQEKPYVCDHPGCGKAFAIAGALTIHKRMHNGHRPFKCQYCGRGFSESSNLTKHLRTHTGDRPYPCPVAGCEKAFARPDQLTRHMSVHSKTKLSAGQPLLKRKMIGRTESP